MRCEKCGAEANSEHKFCEYCGNVLNVSGKDFSFAGTGECFVVDSIFSVMGRSLVIGRALQHLKVGDAVFFNEKRFVIERMQVGQLITTNANVGANCGLILSGFSKKDLKKGDKLVFVKEK